MESYKNILANKFMRDTNYIIIKDTDDLEELERQFELFSTQLTTRQQRLSDDRSIEIWNMTNQEHYESLKLELIKQMDDKFGNTENIDNVFSYDPEEENIDNDDISNIFDDLSNDEFDDNFELPDDENNITESVSEDSKIPIDNSKHIEPGISNIEKDNLADQYEIDTNINIIGRIKGKNKEENLANLEKLFTDFNSQSEDHKKASDDKCIEIYGMTNLDRYNKIKAEILKHPPEKTETIKINADNITDVSKEQTKQLEFVSQVYNNMKVINEEEQIKVNKHKRFNDTPYFTPSEMIDMGVHGNHNFYSKDADNDGLITNVKVPTWFDSYKDMCMDHIFEDYRKDWIDTLDTLYSDFEDIKQSGDQEKILARKQSILDLGWNPEIKFNRKNRLKASERVSKILDETIPSDIFINLNDIPDEYINDEIVEEQMTQKTHKPVLLIFTQGHTPVVSQGIKLFTGSSYSHASISFDPELNEVYSYNMRGENFGFIKENLSSFKDNVISVMAFFAPNNIVQSLKDKIQDFKDNDTTFDLRIFLNKILHIDKKVSKNEYHQVCSTFVDTVLKSGNINLVGDINIPDPGQLYNAAKNIPNKIIEVFNDIAIKYDGKKVKKKISALFKSNIKSIEESITGINLNDIKNGINPYSKKKFYHISFDSDLDEHGPLKPRIPTWITNELKKNENFIETLEELKLAKDSSGFGFEEYKTPRVCFSNSIEGCLNAIINDTGRLKLANKTLYVYTPEKPIDSYKHKTNKQIIRDGDIFDANITNEMWILEPVQLKYVGSIVVDKVNGEHVRKFANNKKKTIIKYDYKWHWFHKIKDNSDKKEIQNEASFVNDEGQIVPKKCPECGSDVGVFIEGEPIYRCTNKECKKCFGVVKPPKHKSIKEQTSILNEVKQFPIEFDKDGNLIIYKARIGSLSFGDEIDDSVQLLESYRNQSNLEGIKYEIAKLWYINDCIEKKLKKRLTNDQYKELIDTRAVCLNAFKFNLDFLMKSEKGFNFSDYYNSTPFSDNSIKITSNTLKYTMKAITNTI